MIFDGITDIHLSLPESGETVAFPMESGVLFNDADVLNDLRLAVIQLGPNEQIVEIDEIPGKLTASRWRVEQMSESRFALRRTPKELPDLSKLGIPRYIISELMTADFRETGGLIPIFGLTGGGKTTTFYATIQARLAAYGGYALTLESPIEYKLEGKHGDQGFCEQMSASAFGGYEQAIYKALRCFPAKENSILGYGEVRNAEEAAQLLRVAVDGHLVIFTCHGKSIADGLSRIVSLAQAAGERHALDLLHSSFLLALHQRFINYKMEISILPKRADPSVMAAMKEGKFTLLENKTQEYMRKFASPSS